MKKLIYIFYIFTVTLFAQEIKQEGYHYVVTETDTISRHNTYRKALEVAINQSNGTYYINQPRIRVKVLEGEPLPIPTTQLEFVGISATNITSTSAMIMVELNSQVFDFAYVKFKKEGDTVWQETSKGKSAIISSHNLSSGTNYIYKVFASDNGVEIESYNQYFKTL